MADDNPKLSVRVVPPDPEQEERDRIGRLYRRPEFVLPENYRLKKVYRELLNSGLLMPSVTNIIDVRSKPYLTGWAAKIVAEEAVRVVRDHPGLIEQKPGRAIDYLKKEPIRYRDRYGRRGRRIHRSVEELAKDEPLPYTDFTDEERLALDHWKRWLDLYQPVFHHLEVTGFGQTADKLNFAGTGDAILSINDHMYAVDYKCVTPDTMILLADGRSVRAGELRVGDRVVAWTDERNLHGAPVSAVEDNGAHPTVTIVTASGHRLEVTRNHPVLAARAKDRGYARADQLQTGDTVFIAAGWSFNPQQRDNQQQWPKDYPLSPYMYAILFTIARHNTGEAHGTLPLTVPGPNRPQLRAELEANKFTFDTEGNLLLADGVRQLAKERLGKKEADFTTDDWTRVADIEQTIYNLINIPTLSPFLHWSDDVIREGFFAGLREVFARRDLELEDFLVCYPEAGLTRELQQLYVNADVRVEYVDNPRMPYLMVPLKPQQEKTHGPLATKIVEIEHGVEHKPTIAIRVEGSHTHVTGGLITHNTNRTGLHVEVAHQLAAVRHFEEITPDSQTMLPMPETVGALGIHISAAGIECVPVDTGEDTWRSFESLRRVWNFHVFEGRHINPRGVLGSPVKSPSDL